MAISVPSTELKNRLGSYLRLVQKGQVVIVTDRGRPVAELRSPGGAPTAQEAVLAEMEARGEIALQGRAGNLEKFEPVAVRGDAVSETIKDDRGERL